MLLFFLGFARRKHREPCRKIVSLLMSLRVDKFKERRIAWDKLLANPNSEPYAQLSYEAVRAVSTFNIGKQSLDITKISFSFYFKDRFSNVYDTIFG